MQAWEKFLTQLESELGVETVNKWLKPLKVVHFDAANLHLQATDTFQVLWFEEHIRKKALNNFVNNNNRRIKVHLTLSDKPVKQKKAPAKLKGTNTTTPLQPAQFAITFDSLSPQCTFDHFVPAAAHLLPYKLLLQTTGCQNSKTELAAFNPIYLCGPAGAGKTHLLMATAQALHIQGLKVIYVRAETFTEHVVTAIRAGEMSLFRQSYRNTDVLIIDDVHIFAKKWATQEELFHTFNTLHVSGKQILLSANCPPGELQFLEPRLISRFEWGIVLPLELPQKEEMRDILGSKARALKFALNQKVSDFLVDTFGSPSTLTRALEALVLRAQLNPTVKFSPTQLTVSSVQSLLTDLIQEEQQTALSPIQVIQHVSAHFGIRSEDILGKAQSRDCVLPRQIAMYLCRIQLKLPFTKIGEIFDKDHSTVMSSVKVIQKSLDNNEAEVRAPLQALIKSVR